MHEFTTTGLIVICSLCVLLGVTLKYIWYVLLQVLDKVFDVLM